jgi:hypothetical protein
LALRYVGFSLCCSAAVDDPLLDVAHRQNTRNEETEAIDLCALTAGPLDPTGFAELLPYLLANGHKENLESAVVSSLCEYENQEGKKAAGDPGGAVMNR